LIGRWWTCVGTCSDAANARSLRAEAAQVIAQARLRAMAESGLNGFH